MPLNPTTVFDDADALCRGALDLVVTLIQEEITSCQAGGRRVSMALSGGSTPKALYAALKLHHLNLASRSVQYFFGDVRMVPDDSPHSNYLMAYEQLLHAVPSDHVVPIATVGCSAEESASQFETTLRTMLPLVDDGRGDGGCPSIDVVLLGVGPDGHTASLFPGTSASLDATRLAVPCMPNEGVQPYVERVTITSRMIQAAKHVVVMAAGKDKHWVLEGMLASNDAIERGDARAPVARLVQQCRGTVHILVDKSMVTGE
jgi:6-phosphogluconolactonase